MNKKIVLKRYVRQKIEKETGDKILIVELHYPIYKCFGWKKGDEVEIILKKK